ncbi:GNAT family N-acetyltransferase [Sphingomonas sp. AR_OL41]|uniref:GNAT family N-acetyltransferase n=1 Tax=Sphingomonas sp. AR_OL41 TaxID=3042729 RepID=UPI0024813400|nr:GNAT family N-acetyltransferase [Sphingomonas sp. AR_OL41]MDH7971194.1 GNAT family N-acetyltransferase [Sphingomonas sp. AR_OL41]
MIETERLILRRDTPADHPALYAMWADPRVMADLGPVKSAADSKAALVKHASYHPQGLGFWVVEHRADGAVMGFCGLKPGAPDTPIVGALEIGWMLAVPYWKQGFAREAAAASMAWAWANRDDAAIVAITSRQNAKSRGLMVRLGMTHVPQLDFAHPLFAEGDPLRDTVTYRIARP